MRCPIRDTIWGAKELVELMGFIEFIGVDGNRVEETMSLETMHSSGDKACLVSTPVWAKILEFIFANNCIKFPRVP